ncbi:hypothetical protein FA10DRAFT_288664 [Acaromyces ingoldii]|uniref:Uncharacterized protein n=1 Tax=Acaromyces ingoldii TaxID=215250 RepID=A0A316YFR7_9BASI|nr:hypothetical protein FA10DRAFT_288664 [Acaromyces ingoldii]PWN87971.1 hypothetical protein FA10DRAFT_288664 [Acaromyces ingoldii]
MGLIKTGVKGGMGLYAVKMLTDSMNNNQQANQAAQPYPAYAAARQVPPHALCSCPFCPQNAAQAEMYQQQPQYHRARPESSNSEMHNRADDLPVYQGDTSKSSNLKQRW